MRPADEVRIPRSPWRSAAMVLLAAALGVATVSLVLGGGQPAMAAGDCQYGPYGPYGPCERVTPTLTIEQHPNETVIGFPLLAATATLEGADPTGTLVFRLSGPWDPTCESTTYEGPVPISGSRTYYSFDSLARAPIPDVVGTWRWTVEYSGDARNEPVRSGCDDAPVTVSRAPMSGFIFVSPFVSQFPIGSTPEARMLIQGYRPSGAATVSLFGPGDPACSGTPTFSTSIPFDGQSALNQLVTLGVVEALGTWRWQLAYSGDARNLPLTTACDQAPLTVVKATPTVTAGVAESPVVIGSAVLTEGLVSNGYHPGGTIQLSLFAPGDTGCTTAADTETRDLTADGRAEALLTPTSVGTWRLRASYPGDQWNDPASTGCDETLLVVVKASPTLAPVSIPTMARKGDVLRARVALRDAYRPGGRVQFRLFAPEDPSCSGVPVYIEEAEVNDSTATTSTGFVVPKQREGTWNWTGSYLGDENNDVSASDCGEASVEVVKKIKKK